MRQMVTTLALALMIPLAACDRSPTVVEEVPTVDGTYHMVAVNSMPLPFLLAMQGEDRVEVAGGSIALERNGRFTDILTLRFTEDGEVEDVDDQVEGTWTQSGGTITLMMDMGGSYPVRVSGDTLTQVINEFTLRYVR